VRHWKIEVFLSSLLYLVLLSHTLAVFGYFEIAPVLRSYVEYYPENDNFVVVVRRCQVVKIIMVLVLVYAIKYDFV